MSANHLDVDESPEEVVAQQVKLKPQCVHRYYEGCTCQPQKVACLGCAACADSSSRRFAGWSSSIMHILVKEKQGSQKSARAPSVSRRAARAALLCQRTAFVAVPLVHCCVVHLCHH